MSGGTRSDVRSMVGVPIAADFYSTKGTPIVINLSTGTAYYLNTTGVVTALGGSGTGDVVGPASSVVGGIATYGDTTGKLLTNTGDAIVGGVGGLRGSYGAGGVSTNVVIGDGAFTSNTTGSQSVAIGKDALKTNSTKHRNVAVGYQALKVAEAQDNVAVGADALEATTDGAFNTAVGSGAMITNTTGTLNTACGYYALGTNLSGSNNSAFGFGALSSNSTGAGNVGFGAYAGKYETGSNAFYVDNQDRTNTTGDKTKALLYGTFNSTAASQTLLANASFTAFTVKAANSGGFISSDGSTGYTGTVTTASLVGKTITIKDGIITGFA